VCIKTAASRRALERYEEMFGQFLATGSVNGYDQAEEMIRRSGVASELSPPKIKRLPVR
jgi:hypothetical protein